MRFASFLKIPGSRKVISAISASIFASLFASVSLATESKADALLQVELNRSAIVERVLNAWRSEFRSGEENTMRQGLLALRADRLLAVTLTGSYDGALQAMLGQVNENGSTSLQVARLPSVTPAVGSALSFNRNLEVDRSFNLNSPNASVEQERGKAIGDSGKDFIYTPITPCRMFDSRTGQASAVGTLGGVMTNQSFRTIPAGGNCGIPSTGVKSLFLSFHSFTYNPPVLGIISFLKPGNNVTAMAATWTGDPWVTGTFITETADSGAFNVFVGNLAPMTADMVIDVMGYFTAADRPGNGLRIVQTTGVYADAPVTINGSVSNTAAGQGASVLSGGYTGNSCTDPANGSLTYGCQNRVSEAFGTVAGGFANSSSAFSASVWGGQSNTAGAQNSTIIGGQFNTIAGTVGQNAVIVGGRTNAASNDRSVVVGGNQNTASGQDSVVIGGEGNTSTGIRSATIGGRLNQATGQSSFAAGNRAQTRTTGGVNHNGAFVWADSLDAAFRSTAADEFSVRARGGVRFVTGATNTAGESTGLVGVFLAPNDSGWTVLSDRASKTSVVRVNALDVLARVRKLPISTWQYKAQDQSVRHIGPMAQDFAVAFGLGATDKGINTIDADGVALAAIQGLGEKLDERDKKILALENANRAMQTELARIKKKLGL
jgi:Chaperone of endosialidase